ncbi:hypothetical protein BGZ83_006808 [Gryganskiella cystojenkinii]|nr:hypothetical protein BGZ83_006808 [Gryganskiella cystojenkinii]
MYPNPYQNNNNQQSPYGQYAPPGGPPPPQNGQFPPPSGTGQYQPPPGAPSTYVPHTSYAPPTSNPGYPSHPPASQGAYPPLPGSGVYPPPATPPPASAGQYGYGSPPIPQPTGSVYPPLPSGPVGAPSGNPFGATITSPYGAPPPQANYGPPPPAPYGVSQPQSPAAPFGAPPSSIPTSIPTPMPTGGLSMPSPQPYGQQPPATTASHNPYPPPPAHANMSSPPYSPVPSMPQPHFQTPHHTTAPPPPAQQQGHGTTGSAMNFQCGPLLRYQNVDIHQGNWIGSVMMVSKAESQGQPAPVLTWNDGRMAHPQQVTAHAIDGYQGAIFWRFALVIPQDVHATKKITYQINHGPSYWFFIAGRSESFRWMFYSCNGFSSSTDSVAIGGANPLWNDALAKHTEHPYHVMIGGGDQLYCDSLLKEPEMEEWLAITSVQEREKVQCKPHWIEAIERYYFNRYCTWFSQGTYGQALAAIPTINMWDDHDTIDGYGSYPESTQKSSTMSTIGAVSRRFYLLFQQHTTPQLVPQHGFFSAGVGESMLCSLGPSAQVLVLDARSERTKNTICSDATYDLAFAKMYNEIPQGTRHLLVQLGVPIAYPRLVFAENLMGSVGNVLGNIAGAKNVVNRLNGEPELLDDLNDHWTAKAHKAERNKFITRLQNLANDRKIRVTFISGDVHCAGMGRFTAKVSPAEKDPQLMYQVISSAIVNEPPPEGVIKLLHFQDKVHVLEGRVKTYEDMYPMFTIDVDGKPLQNDKLLARRNYSHGHFNHHTGGMEITIFAENVRGGPEHTPGADRGTKAYQIHVPRLEA